MMGLGTQARPSSGGLWAPYPGAWNSADKQASYSVSSNADLVTTASDGTTDGLCRGTVAISGLMFWHVIVKTEPNTGAMIGVANGSESVNNYPGQTANSWSIYSSNGKLYNNGSGSVLATYTTGDMLSFAVKVSTGELWIAKNLLWLNSGNPATGAGAVASNLSGTLYPAAGTVDATVAGAYRIAPNHFTVGALP